MRVVKAGMLAGCLVMFSAASPAAAIFSDDFESGLSKWTVSAADGQDPFIETGVTGPDGNSTSVLNTADSNRIAGGFATTKQDFDFVGTGLAFTGDIQRLNGQGVAGLFLKNSSNNATLIEVTMNDDAPFWPNGLSWAVSVNNQGSQSSESGEITSGINVRDWNNIGASIDAATNIVSILLDGNVVAQTANPIFGASSDSAVLEAASRWARYDNINLTSSVPQPGVMALLALGIAGLRLAKRKA